MLDSESYASAHEGQESLPRFLCKFYAFYYNKMAFAFLLYPKSW